MTFVSEQPSILDRQETRLSPWTSVMARTLIVPGKSEPQEYHSLRQADYVSVLAVTDDGRIPLVRQYRPALEKITLELPGGLRDGDDSPAATAIRELEEETGLIASGEPQPLGCLAPDTGRLENRLWGFFVRTESSPVKGWKPELGVECVLVDQRELREWILNGKFDHALHVALIGLAVIQGILRWD